MTLSTILTLLVLLFLSLLHVAVNTPLLSIFLLLLVICIKNWIYYTCSKTRLAENVFLLTLALTLTLTLTLTPTKVQ